MGVPKFYRWISERYPCLSEVVVEFNIPEFDNLYLDMNGIVHVCSHPEDDNPHFRITEEKIFSDIFHYIEFLFRMIKPKKVFFMAIDGVAPRAKMNQQRGRRFRSAYEAEELVKQAEAKGEKLPEEKRFDSNCITPGTEFMARLQEQLRYFVVHKVSSDPLWQGPRIFLSGHQAPGEGEHKIMDFIRYEKSQDGYDPNTRHCLYGLDADLMMLGLTSHEPHFSLLREEVRFGSKKERNKRPPTPEETTFHLLHLSLMREYLEYEFAALKTTLPFPYSLENIIDDWVLMGVLVGNDFIPHLPNLHINHNALPFLWQNYIEVLPTLDGYLNEGGHLNLHRFEIYLQKLSKFDTEKFEETYVDMKWLESKVGGKPINAGCARDIRLEVKRRKKKIAAESNNAFAALINLDSTGDSSTAVTNSAPSNSLNEPTEEILDPDMMDSDTFDAEFRQYKRNYYMDKMKYEVVSPEILTEQAEGYVRAIQWILLYYFEGCPSWGWFYPHHYAPFMSDVKDFSDMEIEFDLGKPFLPFQQLMAVLPAASKALLPEPFQNLMTSSNSPLIEYYPNHFETDLNGKQQEWEAVVLIPFIQEDRLLGAMEPLYKCLPEEAANRNSHGPCFLNVYVPDKLEAYTSPIPDTFPHILTNHAKLIVIPNDMFAIKGHEMKKGLMDGVRLDVFFPGFPTLKHIPHTVKLKKECVKVFQQMSRGESMMVSITQSGADLDPDTDFEEFAQEYLGQSVYVGWPHLFEAKVVSVDNEDFRFDLVESDKGKKSKEKEKIGKILHQHTKQDAEIWRRKASSIQERYLERRGVDVGHTSILLHCCPMTGRKYICGSHGKITLEKQFGNLPVAFAKQATVKDIAVHDSSFCQYKTLSELFEEKVTVFMLGSPHYGCQGEVIEVQQDAGKVRVRFTTVEEPNIHNIMYKQQSLSTRYMPSYLVAQRLGVSSHFVARLTGNIFILRGAKENPKNNNKVNVGLNLKFSKRGEEVPGYVKRMDGQWCYSEQTIQTLQEYFEKYYEILDCLSNAPSSGQDLFYEQDLFQSDSEVKLNDILTYLKNLPCMKITPIKCDADILDESVVEAIEEEVKRLTRFDKPAKTVVMQVKPHLLFKPTLDQEFLIPDPSVEYFLFDRVVCVRMGFPVRFGLRGTVVGIHPPEEGDDTIYEVVFDEDFVGGISVRCSPSRGYRVRSATLINLSHGERKNSSAGSTSTPQGFKLSVNNWTQDSGSKRQSYSQMKNDRPGFSNSWNYNSRDQQQQSRRQDNQGFYNGNRGGYQDAEYQRGYRRHDDRNVDRFSVDSKAPFVAPKVVTSPVSASTKWGIQNRVLSDNSARFADMWKQLQESAEVLPIPATQAPPSGTSDSSNKGTSLQQAAMGLDQISLPSASNVTTSASSVSTSATSVVTSSVSQLEESPRNIDVNLLLSKDSKSEDICVKSNESFDIGRAISESIQNLTVNSEHGDVNNSCQTNQLSQDDGSTALKQMLKINSDESSPPEGSTKKAAVIYGKQVSVQELFEGAKLSSSKSETTVPEPSKTQQQQQFKSPQQHQQTPPQHQQQQQRPQHQQQKPQQQQHNKQQENWNPQMNQHHQRQQPQHPQQQQRNPVMELADRCKAMQLHAPQYDYITQRGKVISRVVLGNGVRFEGSSCTTREEAAESVASIAMLNLPDFNNYPQYPPFLNFQHPDPMFSQQSAFSPVGRPAFSPRVGAYSQLRQFHHRHPVPGYFARGPGYQQRGGHRGFPQDHPGQLQQPAFYSPNIQTDVTGQNADDVKKHMTVTDPAFIPLQVARKQKTPQKRKDVVYPDQAAAVHVDDVRQSNMPDAGASVGSYQNLKNEHSKSKSDGSASKQKSAPRKRRPRIAANLNFDQ